MRRTMKWMTIAGCLSILLTRSAAVRGQTGAEDAPRPAAKAKAAGDSSSGVFATGTVEPVNVVDVGAQVAGRVVHIGVDYGERVKEGDELARIDDANERSTLEEAEARLNVAQAKVALAQAKLQQAELELKRAETIGKTVAISQAEVDAARSAVETAKAGMAIARAEATLQKVTVVEAKRGLDHTVIRSPITGTVIDRRINVGQMLTARIDAPSLFLVADLSKLEIWTAVAEADIGKLHVGQPAKFTVDAVPDKTFEGRVRQIRLNATMTQNRVTYTVVVAIDNADKLLPYLTANVQFITESEAPGR